MLSTANLNFKQGARKLQHKFIGPFLVKQLIGPVAPKLILLASLSRLHSVFHVSLLEKNSGDPTCQQVPPPILINNKLEYNVKAILDRHGPQTNPQYLVKWEGYPFWESTWEPQSNLQNAQEFIQKFDQDHPHSSKCSRMNTPKKRGL